MSEQDPTLRAFGEARADARGRLNRERERASEEVKTYEILGPNNLTPEQGYTWFMAAQIEDATTSLPAWNRGYTTLHYFSFEDVREAEALVEAIADIDVVTEYIFVLMDTPRLAAIRAGKARRLQELGRELSLGEPNLAQLERKLGKQASQQKLTGDLRTDMLTAFVVDWQQFREDKGLEF